MAVYVGSLACGENWRDLSALFAAYGTVVYAKVVAHDDDCVRRHGGFGIVEMSTKLEARTAIRALDNSEFRGRTLRVRAATAAEETTAGHPRMFGTMNMPGRGTDDDEEE
jgi:RNA recognition motif-containing protein